MSVDYADIERRLFIRAQIAERLFPPVHDGYWVTLPKTKLIKPGDGLVLPQKKCLRIARWQWNKTVKQMCAESERVDDYLARRAEEVILGKVGGHVGLTDIMRKRRGQDMALDPRIKPVSRSLWEVPSSKGRDVYNVDVAMGTCDCPDYLQRKQKCKHIYAVEVIQHTTWSVPFLRTPRRRMLSFVQAYGTLDAKFYTDKHSSVVKELK
jgi:hypothetical protein